MAQDLTIRVGTDLSQVEAGAAKMKSALDGAAKGGIAAFEKTQQKVIDLTKRMAELQAAILKTDDPAQLKNLNNSLGETRQRLQAAKTEMRGMTLDTREATEKAQLLASTFGVRLPGEISKVIARSHVLQVALEAAFSASILAGFIGGLGFISGKFLDLIGEGKTFGETLSAALKPISRIFEDILLAGAKLATFIPLIGGGEEGRKAVDALIQARKELRELEAKTGDVGSITQDVARLRRQWAQEDARNVEKLIAKTKAFLEHQREVTAEIGRSGGAMLALEKFLAKEQQQRDLGVAALEAEEAVRRAGLQDAAELGKKASDVWADWGKSAADAAKKQQEAFDKMASGIENFFDRVFLTARSFGDVMKQLTMQLVGSLVKSVSRILAGIFLGGQSSVVSGQSSVFGGGILGAIFGGRGSGLGVGRAISTPPFAPSTLNSQLSTAGLTGIATLPMTGGILAGGTGTPSAIGGATQGVGGALSFGGLTSLLPAGLLLGGTALLGRAGGRGGPITGAIGGAALALGVTTSLLAAYGLPIGLVFGPAGLAIIGIAAGIGALLGAYGRGRAKNKAAGIEEEFRETSKAVLEQYKKFQVDYDSAIGSMQALLLQGQQAEAASGTGKWGRKGAENLARSIQSQIKEVRRIQRQRDATFGTLAGLPVPEFAVGGPVSSRGGILALLHPGEFVMQKSAVDSLGTQFLGALNRAPRFDSGGAVSPAISPRGGSMNVGPVYVFPAANMSRRQAMNMVVRGFRDAQKEGAI